MFARPPRESSRVDITSMIDVVFIILIFFIVTTQFAQQAAVEIQLPRTEGSPRRPEARESQLEVDAEGRLFLDGAPVELAALESRLATLFKTQGGTERVLPVKADGRASWEVMAGVLDACRRAGVTTAVPLTAPRSATDQETTR